MQLNNVDIAILSPTAVEWLGLVAHLQQAVDVEDVPLPMKVGRIGPHTVVCCCSGKGQEETASTATLIIERAQPAWILLVGIAGGFPEHRLALGDVMIAHVIHSFDYGKLVDGKFRRRPENDINCDRSLLQWSEVVAQNPDRRWREAVAVDRPDEQDRRNFEVHLDCYVASSNKVVDDPNHTFYATVAASFAEIHGVEMEGIGAGASTRLAQGERALGFLMIRGISDTSGAKSGKEVRGQWKNYAVATAAAFTHALIEQLPARRPKAASSNPPSALGFPSIFRSRLKPFLEEYLVSDSGEVPFGGRDAELKSLDRWLCDETAPRRMLITGRAGRGKTALLLHWIKALYARNTDVVSSWQVAFMPISARAGTNRSVVFHEGLARRLAEILGEPLPTDAMKDADALRFVIRDQLERVVETGIRVLVVIDGIDEALSGHFNAQIFPPAPSRALRIVVSARILLGDADCSGWLRRLDWERNSRAAVIELGALDADEIADVLVKLGAPLDVLASEQQVVKKLVELTAGEPLVVRFYCEDLWEIGRHRPAISRSDLDHLKPGFQSYFERWLELQETIWRDEEPYLDRRKVDAVLSILAFALGQLEEHDLLTLMERIYGIHNMASADRLLWPLRRFVFGNGKAETGYALSHPMIGEYLADQRFSARAGEIKAGFAAWGSEWVTRVNAGNAAPSRVPRYALQYLARHLEDCGALPERFMDLVQDGWRKAWEHLEGGQRGFADAVRTARTALRRTSTRIALGSQWRCALTLSSIKSLGHLMPRELIVRAVASGTLSIRQGRYLAESIGSEVEGAVTLAELAREARSGSACMDLLEEAIRVALCAPDQLTRAMGLEGLAHTILHSNYTVALMSRFAETIFEASRAFSDPFLRMLVSSGVIQHLPKLKAARCVDALLLESEATPTSSFYFSPRGLVAEAVATAIQIARSDDELLDKISVRAKDAEDAAFMEHARRGRILHVKAHLMSAFRSIPGVSFSRQTLLASVRQMDRGLEPWRSDALAQLLPGANIDEAEEISAQIREAVVARPSEVGYRTLARTVHLTGSVVIPEVVEHAYAISDPEVRGKALIVLASTVTGDRKKSVTSSALDLIRQMRKKYERMRALREIVPHLSDELMPRAWAMARAFRTPWIRADVLVAINRVLPKSMIGDAIQVAKRCRDPKVLASLLPRMDARERERCCPDLLSKADRSTSLNDQSDLLIALAPHLSASQLDAAVSQTFRLLGHHELGTKALSAIASRLTTEQLVALLMRVSTSPAGERAAALSSIVRYLPRESLPAALVVGKTIGDQWQCDRALVLSVLTRNTGQPQTLDDLARVCVGKSREAPLELMASIASHLPEPLLWEASARACSCRDLSSLANLLRAARSSIPTEIQSMCLEAVKPSAAPIYRQPIFDALIPELPDELMEAALDAAWNHGDFTEHALVALSSRLPPRLYPEAVRIARAIPRIKIVSESEADSTSKRRPSSKFDAHQAFAQAFFGSSENARFGLICGLAGVSREILDEFLTLARKLQYPPARAEAFVKLAYGYDTLNSAERVVAEAFDLVWGAAESYKRAKLLAALARLLNTAQLEETIERATKSEPHEATGLLAAVVRHLTDSQKSRILAMMRLPSFSDVRGRFFTHAIPYLQGKERNEALAAALSDALASVKDSSEDFRHSELPSLLQYLETAQIKSVLTTLRTRCDGRLDLQILRSIATLPAKLTDLTFEFAVTVADNEMRVQSLQLVARGELRLDQRVTLIAQIMDAAPSVRRDVMLAALGSCVEIIRDLAGPTALLDVTTAVTDVASWYP